MNNWIVSLLKDERGNGVLMFMLMLVILMSTILIAEADYAKVLLTKVSLSMVADIAASEAAKEIDMNLATSSGITKLNKTRALNTAKKYINENRALLPIGLIKPQIDINGSQVEVLLTSPISLSNAQTTEVKARGSAWVRNLK